MCYLGIDIGIAGAVAILDQDGALIEVHDMPVLLDGPAGRRSVNAPLLASIIYASHAARMLLLVPAKALPVPLRLEGHAV